MGPWRLPSVRWPLLLLLASIGFTTLGVVEEVRAEANGRLRLIEVNANPSIRFLEHCERPDLILKIWRHTFAAMELLVV